MSWGPHSSFERERQIRCRLLTSSIKREIRDFHAVVVQWRQRNVQKSVLHVESCCFANQTYAFLTFSLPTTPSLLKLLTTYWTAFRVDNKSYPVSPCRSIWPPTTVLPGGPGLPGGPEGPWIPCLPRGPAGPYWNRKQGKIGTSGDGKEIGDA